MAITNKPMELGLWNLVWRHIKTYLQINFKYSYILTIINSVTWEFLKLCPARVM